MPADRGRRPFRPVLALRALGMPGSLPVPRHTGSDVQRAPGRGTMPFGDRRPAARGPAVRGDPGFVAGRPPPPGEVVARRGP
jgi:hypothetical protein